MNRSHVTAITIIVAGFASVTLGLALILKPSPQVVAQPQAEALEAVEEPQAPAVSTPTIED